MATTEQTPQLPSETKLAVPLDLAITFHETYERLAPSFGYETRKETRAFDPTTPNGRLMIAVCGELISRFYAPSPANAEAGDDCTCERVQMSENGQRLNCPDCGRVYKRNTRPYGRGWQIAPRIGPTDPDNAEAGDRNTADLLEWMEAWRRGCLEGSLGSRMSWQVCEALRSLAAVQEELRVERTAATNMQTVAAGYRSERDALARENERLREALREYGQHEDGCNYEGFYAAIDGPAACTCGLDAALAPVSP